MTDNAENVQTRGLKDYLGLTARGFAMGSADVVPGVSGGTMAFILGIYEELVESIKALASPAAIQLVLKFRWTEAFRVLPWRFLLAVAVGILTAVLTLARVLEWTLENYPVFLWSFFFGLVLASIFIVSKAVKVWGVTTVIGTVAAAIGSFWLVGLVPVETPNDWWFLILSGAMAICAMILPGISGALILVLLGKYQYILAAVNDRDFLTVGLVGFGAVVGIVSFAQVVSFLFKRYHNATVAVLTGLLIGSLRELWPWKEVVETRINSAGEVVPLLERNIAPPSVGGELLAAIGLALLGFAIVFGMDYWASRQGGGDKQPV